MIMLPTCYMCVLIPRNSKCLLPLPFEFSSMFNCIILNNLLSVCVPWYIHGGSGDNLQESVLFYHVDARDQTQVTRLATHTLSKWAVPLALCSVLNFKVLMIQSASEHTWKPHLSHIRTLHCPLSSPWVSIFVSSLSFTFHKKNEEMCAHSFISSTTKVTCYLCSVSSWLLFLITNIFWKSLCNRSWRPLSCFHDCMIPCVRGRYPSFMGSYERTLSCFHFFLFYFIFINNYIVIVNGFYCIVFHFCGSIS